MTLFRKETNPDFEESRKVLRKIMIPILIPLLIFFVWAVKPWRSLEDDLIKAAPALKIEGRIISIYNDKPNHNVEVFTMSDNQKYIIITPGHYQPKVGDSISKHAKTMLINVFRTNGTDTLINYKDLVFMRYE